MRRLPKGNELVAVESVSVVAAGGFLAESAPVARLFLRKPLRRLLERGERACVLLSHEQRRAFEEALRQAKVEHLVHGIRCYRVDVEGAVVPERWSNGCNAWVDIEEAAAVQRQVREPAIDMTWRCRLVWQLVKAAQ